jgi:hypothetical protein
LSFVMFGHCNTVSSKYFRICVRNRVLLPIREVCPDSGGISSQFRSMGGSKSQMRKFHSWQSSKKA